MKRTIVLHDLHGCADTLRALLTKIEYRSGVDRLVLGGDYIDRGKHIRETIEYVKVLRENGKDLVTLLLGNHEEMFLQVVNRIGKNAYWRVPEKDNTELLTRAYDEIRVWYQNGGVETERQLLSAENYKDVAAFFEGMPFYYQDPENRFFVTHAGAYKGLEYDDPDTLLWDRDFSYKGSPVCICGHTSFSHPGWTDGRDYWVNYEENVEYDLPESGVIHIDTGCVFGGYLTALVIEGSRFQVIFQKNMD